MISDAAAPDPSAPSTATTAATFCATLVDEWARAGVSTAFVSADSPATSLARALAEHPAIAVHRFLHEQSAAFAALGHGLRRGTPAVALCFADAAAQFQPAVSEADLSSVPLLVVTAQRASGRSTVGWRHTIVQGDLFGSAVRFHREPGVLHPSATEGWRSLGSRLMLEAMGWSGRPGPVHLALGVQQLAAAGPLPPGRDHNTAWHRTPARPPAVVADPPQLSGRRGVIIAGAGTESPNAVLSLADALGWPVLADHQSGCRAPGTIAHYDAVLQAPAFTEALSLEIVLQFGQPLESTTVSQWLAGLTAEFVNIVPNGRWLDPEGRADVIINDAKTALTLLGAVDGPPSRDVDVWRWVDALAADAIETALENEASLGPPAVAREVVGGVDTGSALVVASDSARTDLERFAPARDDIEVYGRGAGRVDGTVAVAIGVASTGVPTTLLVQDVALLHDSASLPGLADRPIDLTIVVVENDDRLEPHLKDTPGSEIEAVAAAHGLVVHRWGQATDPWDRVRLVLVTTEREQSLALGDRLNAAVVGAVTSALATVSEDGSR